VFGSVANRYYPQYPSQRGTGPQGGHQVYLQPTAWGYPNQGGYWNPPVQQAGPLEPEPAQRKASQAPSILVLVGAALLISTFFLPWYAVTMAGTDSSNNSFTGYFDINSLDGCYGGVALSSSGSSQNLEQCEFWFQAGASGFLFLIAALLLIVGMILGGVGGGLGLKSSSARGPVMTKTVKRPYKMARNAFIILLVAFILFFLVSILNVEVAEAGLCTGGSTASPVYGSCPWAMSASNGGKVTGTLSWAPGIGLALALVGVIMVLVGMVKLRRYYMDMSQWDPTTWEAQPTPPPMTYYPQPTSRAGPMVGQAMGGQAPLCPSCGQYTSYIPSTQSWYCHNCSQLVR